MTLAELDSDFTGMPLLPPPPPGTYCTYCRERIAGEPVWREAWSGPQNTVRNDHPFCSERCEELDRVAGSERHDYDPDEAR